MDEKGLGRRLQAARLAAGFTQQSLCQKANLSYSTLAKIERGAIKSPSIFTIESIAGALGVTLDDLIGRPSVMPAAIKQRRHSKSGVGFVYFDVNGCLVRSYHRAFTKLAHDSGQPADTVETAFWHYNDQVCRGEMSLADFNMAFAKQLAMPSLDWLSYYLAEVESMPDMAELVTWASQYYGVGLLTNIMPGLLPALRQRGIIPDITYDSVVDSSEVHAIKPEPKIYEVATGRANCAPEEILLIDDSRANLMAAEKFGWRVLWFDDSRPEESAEHVRKALEPANNNEPQSLAAEPVAMPSPTSQFPAQNADTLHQ
jgi:FMN phosphatase YigB (HAD superfamily)/DNA-binding XRE family transcriptional regulator